ncbi:MAG: zinc-dependent metalloprotease [Fimbriimonadales bacterium]|nr:zinc-dependent metalloprotease [Fimbriimonadales bacterium]MDW8322426.1 M12 family metallo-peptidase [Armatimonadota bacterium]
MRTITRFISCLLLLSGAFWGRAETEPQKQNTAPGPLFLHIRPAKPPAQPDLRGMLEYQPVSIRWETLYALQPGSRVELNLLKGYSLIAYIERVERRGERSVSYFGKLDGVPDGYSHVILTNEGAVLLATVYSPPLGIEFGVTSHREGYHIAYRVDPTVRGGCGTGAESPDEPSPSETTPPSETETQGDFSPAGDFDPAACVQPTATVDMMVVYTPAVRTFRGSHEAVRAAAQLGVDVSNTIYQNSQIPLYMRLVHVAEVAYDEGSDTFGTHRNRLRDNGDGFMDIVHTWRDWFRADDVALFVADDDGGTLCGLAFANHGLFWEGPVQDRAFFVLDARNNSCIALGWAAFTHELGHNQGCSHNRADAGFCGECNFPCSECTSRYPYSYGFRFQGTDGQRYITVMSYQSNNGDCTGNNYAGMPQIPYFSNPNITYAGVAIGRHEGDGCAADNARTVRNTSRRRENFRLLDIWVQFGYSGTERGTFTEPFNTVAEGAGAITDHQPLVLPTLYIKAGSSTERPLVAKRMRIEACGGTVRIGAP